MSKSKVITIPNPILKEKTEKISTLNDAIKSQIREMVAVLRKEGGIGLAANQLGYKNSLVVVEFVDPEEKNHIPLSIFINPEIVEYSTETDCYDEGCLSIPKIELELSRPAKLKIKYEDEHGHKLKIAPKGLLARILQHEIDHLNGILFIQRARTQVFENYPELKQAKIAFLGSGEFAAIILEGLIHLGLKLKIYTEKSRQAGRGQQLKKTAVAERAEKFGKSFTEVEDINSYPIEDCDLLICADFGQILSAKILNKPRISAINIHPSLLPKFRGPTPIQNAILRGEKVTGVSIIEMSPEVDKGPVLTQADIEINDTDDYPVLRDKLATLGIKLLAKNLGDIFLGKLKGAPQPAEKKVTKKLTKAAGKISWNKSAAQIEHQIRALHPWPGTYTTIGGKRLIIHSAHLEGEQLVLDLVQLEGKNPLLFSEFLRGYKGTKPEWFDKIKK